LISRALISPFILLSYLGLLFWGKIIGDSECLSDFLWCFAYYYMDGIPLINVATFAQQS
jgi:hypothetical protein